MPIGDAVVKQAGLVLGSPLERYHRKAAWISGGYGRAIV